MAYRDNLTNTHKQCSICKQWKLFSEFKHSKTGAGNLSGKCLECMGKKYSSEGKQRKSYHLKRRYGISEYELLDMLEKQGGKCAICGVEIESHNVCVDHCHTSNLVRGILCRQCNVGLGMFKDSVSTLKKAIEYLARNV